MSCYIFTCEGDPTFSVLLVWKCPAVVQTWPTNFFFFFKNISIIQTVILKTSDNLHNFGVEGKSFSCPRNFQLLGCSPHLLALPPLPPPSSPSLFFSPNSYTHTHTLRISYHGLLGTFEERLLVSYCYPDSWVIFKYTRGLFLRGEKALASK